MAFRCRLNSGHCGSGGENDAGVGGDSSLDESMGMGVGMGVGGSLTIRSSLANRSVDRSAACLPFLFNALATPFAAAAFLRPEISSNSSRSLHCCHFPPEIRKNGSITGRTRFQVFLLQRAYRASKWSSSGTDRSALRHETISKSRYAPC